MKNAQINWDDLRFVLAVADEGSVAAAARVLNVNHATVLRRIAAFETAHGLLLFDKTSRGYRISANRRELIEAMREAGTSLNRIGTLIDAERPAVTGRLRVTSTDSFCTLALPEIARDLADGIDQPVDLLSANLHVDFSRLQADIAIRPADKLPDDLHGLRAGKLGFSVFAAKDGASNWLGLSGPLQRSKAAEWLDRQTTSLDRSISADSFLTLASLAAAGAGRAVLPTFVGHGTPGLVLIDKPQGLPSVPIWVACHRDLARSGRLTKARRFFVDRLSDIQLC
ncbi:MAG: LysR family transcriptional regulator [Boseongicola sp.]